MTISEDITARAGLLFEAARPDLATVPTPAAGPLLSGTFSDVEISVYSDLGEVESDWRAFEAIADGTAFQTFAWHAAWQRHIGGLDRVLPVIVVGRVADEILFIAPLAIEQVFATRRLVWHGWRLCDYNAPLLASGFADSVSDERFVALWRDTQVLLTTDRRFAHDLVMLNKMPGEIGALKNPFVRLPVDPHASSAYAMALSGDWETFYRTKRSSATRRHARAKLKNLGDIGPVSMVTAESADAVTSALTTLFEQKAASFARMGVADFLARPGHRDFYCALAAEPANRALVHVSELCVGEARSAVNLGMIFHRRYYHVLASHGGGAAIERFGPGTHHLHTLIAYAIERGCHIFDFTIGDESYKRDWCEQHIPLWNHCRATSVRGAIFGAGWSVAARLKRFVKGSAALWNFYRLARRTIASFRGARPEEARDAG